MITAKQAWEETMIADKLSVALLDRRVRKAASRGETEIMLRQRPSPVLWEFLTELGYHINERFISCNTAIYELHWRQ